MPRDCNNDKEAEKDQERGDKSRTEHSNNKRQQNNTRSKTVVLRFLDSWYWSFQKCFRVGFGGIFNVQIQSERGHKFVQLMCNIKVKDLLDIYKWDCGPFCVSLMTELIDV